MEKILLDNNAVDMVRENYDLFEKGKRKFSYYISSTILEEFANMQVPNFERLKSLDEKIRLEAIESCKKRQEKFITNLLCVARLSPILLSDSVFAFGHSRLGFACLGTSEVFNIIKEERKVEESDAIIADTAVNNGCYLLTNDKHLSIAMKEYKYRVLNLSDFEALVKNM